jgi:predicted small metal-binding protein
LHSRRPKNTSPFSWVSPCVHRGGWTRNLLTDRNPYAGGSFLLLLGENSVPLVPFRWWRLPKGFRQNAMPAHVFVQISLSAPCFACAGRAPKCNHEAQANHATEFIQRLPGKYHRAHVLERLVRSLMVFILFSFLCWNGRVKAKAGFFSLKAAVV